MHGPGELYEQLEVDLTSMELCVANPADEACARLQLEDLLYWLQVSSGNFLALLLCVTVRPSPTWHAYGMQPRGPFAKDLRVWVVGDWESRSGETLSRALRMCSNLERLHMTSQSRWAPLALYPSCWYMMCKSDNQSITSRLGCPSDKRRT